MTGNLIRGTRRDNVLIGTETSDHIVAGRGLDYVFGGAGDDFVSGGAGVDHLSGESGDDVLFGGEDDDVVEGGQGEDVVSGDEGADWLDGGASGSGDDAFDALLGGAGDDTIFSGTADLIDGGSGNDLAVINRQGSAVAIRADFGDVDRIAVWADGTVITEVERVDFFGGSGADVVRGGEGADRMFGGIGADRLSGGGGIDLLNGGSGRDRLVGGAGEDIFAFQYGTGQDRILDFVQGEDRIDLYTLGAISGRVLGAISRDDATGLVTIDLAMLNDAPDDRIELVTAPGTDLELTLADFIVYA